MKMPSRWLTATLAMLGLAAATMQPELLLPAAVFASAYAVKRRNERLAFLERRLNVTEGELDQASFELENLRKEREFDRKLLHAREYKVDNS